MRYTGIHTFPEQNPRAWWWLFWGLNGSFLIIALFTLLPSAILGRGIATISVAVLIAIPLVNAVLVPIMIPQLKKRVSFDFDNGVFFSNDSGPLFASHFTMLVHTRRLMGLDIAGPHTLVFHTSEGAMVLKQWMYRDSPEIAARNEAALAFIWQWLQIPDHYSQLRDVGFSGEERVIGKQEALALLRRTAVMNPSDPYPR